MKNRKSVLSLVLAIAMLAALLTGCGPKLDTNQISQAPAQPQADAAAPAADAGAEAAAPSELSYADGTVLRMATGYNSVKTGLSFDAETAGDGITLADGNTYRAGDLKPTWVEVQNLLKISIEDKYQGNSASNEFDYWKERLGEVDMLSGTAAKLTEYGEAGSLVNIGAYLDQMPNFKAYLEKNPIVRLSITGNTSNGAIYFSPYFDGVNDIERMPLMRVDWVQKLLDGEGEFSASASKQTAAPVYQPYMPTSGKISIDTVKLDGSGVETVTKDYDAAGNIIEKMNAAGSMSGVDAVNMLRTYIDEAYGGYYGTQRSNLFCGQNAAWDADELVALLRCVVANPQTLNGTDSIQGLFSREDDNNQRRVDMMRFAGHLFGVRGLESRQDYLFFDTNGDLHDARQEVESYKAMERMNAMAMVPVACWQDGTSGGNYMRFTESWRSVKTDGWGISKAGTDGNADKLNAALKLIDFAYSDRGMVLMSYGPDAFIKTNPDGSYVTFTFNGQQMPEIADATYAELWEKAKGNYTNYARMYLGSTLSFVKNQAFEYQCTQDVGREGAGYISTAIGLGTIKHPELAVTSNPWYTSVPTVLPNTKQENDLINTYTDLSSKGKFSQNKGESNEFVNEIVGGYTEQGMGSAEAAAAAVKDTMGGAQYLQLKQSAWTRVLDYYNTL